MSGALEHGLFLVAAQRDALLAGDALAAQQAGSRLTDWLLEFGPALRDGSAGAAPQLVTRLRHALESNALIARRRASFAGASLAAIAGSAPVYESAGFSARPAAPGRDLTA